MVGVPVLTWRDDWHTRRCRRFQLRKRRNPYAHITDAAVVSGFISAAILTRITSIFLLEYVSEEQDGKCY